MGRERAFKFRFYPSGAQERLLRRQFGSNRKVWNWGLAYRQAAWERDQTRISGYDLMKLLPALKDEFPFLREVSDVPLQQALRDQDRAFSNFFASLKGERAGARVRFPKPKNRNSRKSARFTRSGFRFRDGRLFLAKMKQPLAIEWSRPLPDGATPSSVTVSLDSAGRWFVSILCVDQIDALEVPDTARAVGIDLGLKTFAVLSDGTEMPHPRLLARKEARLRRYQRALSRKVGNKRGEAKSRNFERARRKVAKQHARVADARRDFLHKTTTDLVRRYDVIVVEDLAVKNMVRNRRLAKSISDSGWAEFRTLLDYKTDWYGKRLIVIDRFEPTSKKCSTPNCGAINQKLTLSDRSWVCDGCGTRHDRDVNAAKNILAAGLAVPNPTVRQACGEDVRPKQKPRVSPRTGRQTSTKQEPTEARLTG